MEKFTLLHVFGCYGSDWLITNSLGLVNTINMDLFIEWSFGYLTSCQVRGLGDDGESKQIVIPVSVSLVEHIRFNHCFLLFSHELTHEKSSVQELLAIRCQYMNNVNSST